MSRFWSDLASSLTPYVPGEQPRQQPVIKLNTNENPYPPSPRVAQAVAAIDPDSLRLYPDPQSTALCGALARRYNLQPQQVFVGNGSDEVLALAFMGLLKHEQPLCFPDITYSFYPVWSGLSGVDYVEVPVDSDLAVDIDAFPQDCGAIIVPNPNAPTGQLLSLDEIRSLLASHADTVVVIDEAYIDFGGDSAVSLIDDHDNLLVIQTLSKSGSLAGLRVGFALGDAQLIEGLERVKNSFNSYPLDRYAQVAAQAAIEDEPYCREICERIAQTRATLTEALTGLGFVVLPSSANFVFASHPDKAAKAVFEHLREQGILVRYFNRPRIDNYLRISIGTEDECEALLAALRQV